MECSLASGLTRILRKPAPATVSARTSRLPPTPARWPWRSPRDLPRVAPQALGELERDVARVIAVLRVRRALDQEGDLFG